MSARQRDAVEALGWTASTWDAGDGTPFETPWGAMTAAGRGSAELLGFGPAAFAVPAGQAPAPPASARAAVPETRAPPLAEPPILEPELRVDRDSVAAQDRLWAVLGEQPDEVERSRASSQQSRRQRPPARAATRSCSILQDPSRSRSRLLSPQALGNRPRGRWSVHARQWMSWAGNSGSWHRETTC